MEAQKREMKNFLRRMPSSRPTLIWYRVFAFIVPHSGLFFILYMIRGKKRIKFMKNLTKYDEEKYQGPKQTNEFKMPTY